MRSHWPSETHIRSAWPRRSWLPASFTSCGANPARPDTGRKERSKGMTEFALPLLLGQARVFFGWALAGLGKWLRASARCERALQRSPRPAPTWEWPPISAPFARACGGAGRCKRGTGCSFEQAFDKLAKSDSNISCPSCLSAKGELLLRLDPLDDAAEDSSRKSLVVASEQGARLAELRAAFRLARLYARRAARGRSTRSAGARLRRIRRGVQHT